MIAFLSTGILFSIILFWAIHEIKTILFWVYLWQTKEYLWGRLRDHFSTHRGKRLIVDIPTGIKLCLVVFSFLFFFPATPALGIAAFAIAWLVYLLQAFRTILHARARRLKLPAWTLKTAALTGGSILTVLLLGALGLRYGWLTDLLIVDILTPFVVAAVVFALEPVAVWQRKSIIRRATIKRAQFPKLKVVGIAGSYGKTSVKEFLAHILSQKFKTLKTAEHRNSEVGIAKTILEELRPEHEVFVCEMGAYRRGGIDMLCRMAQPQIGILTGINEQHMATFGSLQNIIDTKLEIVRALPEGGVAVINGDNAIIQKACLPERQAKVKIQKYGSKVKSIYCSAKERAEIWAEDIKVGKEWVEFTARTKEGESAGFHGSTLGAHNIQNILLAAGAARELGMTLKEIAHACETIAPATGAITLQKGINNTAIINSSYSANPDGVISDLEYLALWPGKKIIVMPCLIELGSASATVHERIGRAIGTMCDLAIITTRDRFDRIQKGAMESGMPSSRILYSDNPSRIASLLSLPAYEKATVLLEGRSSQEIIKRIIIS